MREIWSVDVYWITLTVLYCYVGVKKFYKYGFIVKQLILKQSQPLRASMLDLEQLQWHKEQQFFKSQIKTANLLLYGFLPLGLVTFLIQIIDDIIVHEEHLIHDIVLFRNMFEIFPVIILILVYKEVDKRYMSEEDLSKLDIVMNDLSSYV